MRKRLFFVYVLFSLCALSFAEEDYQLLVKAFVKGSVTEKTAIVHSISSEKLQKISLMALDFVLDSYEILGSDRDLSALAIATVLSLPENSVLLVKDKLLRFFDSFDDETVKMSVLEKLSSSSDFDVHTEILSLFSKLIKSDTKSSLKYLNALSNSQNYKYNKNFLAEVAENALSEVINIIEEITDSDLKSDVYSDLISLQMLSLKIVSEAQWTRASSIVLKCFKQCCREYNNGLLDEDVFISSIKMTSMIPSTSTVSVLSDYLASFNSRVESGELENPPEQVLLSIIDALGNLGDKSAFDNLLYVTYLNYSDAVISKARESLARLRW